MGTTMFFFSGQGSQYPGMGKDFYDNFAIAREIYTCASDILGFDVAKISFEGTVEELAQTKVSQPAIFTHSIIAYTLALEEMEPPKGIAGHSLGEYAALYAGGAYSLEDGFRIIGARAEAMSNAAEQAGGAMYAILRKDLSVVQEACQEAGGLVLPVNLNTPQQTVISGEEAAVKRAVALLEAQGARAMKLGVSSAFHTSLMTPAAEALKEMLQEIEFHQTTIPFFSNVTGESLEIEDYPAYFAQHMVSPVRFVEEVNTMVSAGMEKAVECGPKNVVANLVKKNNKAIATTNVENIEGLRKLKTF